MGTRDLLLKAALQKVVTVELDLEGEDGTVQVRMRSMTGADRAAFGDLKEDSLAATKHLIRATVVNDDDDAPMFVGTEGEKALEMLLQGDGKVTDALWRKALEISGLRKGDPAGN